MKVQTTLIKLQFLLPLCSVLNMIAAEQPEKQPVVYAVVLLALRDRAFKAAL